MNYPLLYQWEQLLAGRLTGLHSWQQANVALFSYGVIKAESCQQGAIARAVRCGEQVSSTARRFRRFLDNAAFPLAAFFADWSGWVIEAFGQDRITLLVEETNLHDRIGVMLVGLAWEGRCLPLAWRVYRANDAADYPAEGQVGVIAALLQSVKQGIGTDVQVLVLADRGLGCSPALCQVVSELGWYYLFRVTCQTKIVTASGDYAIARQVQPGEIWAASGQVFKQRGRLPAHARALWSVGYDEPWALVTNDEQVSGREYGQRTWQEQSFRDFKSGGWHWGESRISDPDHMARLLVVLALAYTWMVALGSQAVAADRGQPLVRRLVSLFKEGLTYFVDWVERYTVCLGLVFIPDKRFT
jgi:hypothetical protein